MLFSEISKEEWRALREKYNYPAVRLLSFAVDAGTLTLSEDTKRQDEATDDELENYHKNLLLSDSPEDQLLGAASTAFWGWYGSSSPTRKPTPRRALKRASFVINGHRGKIGENPAAEISASKLTRAALMDGRSHLLKNELKNAFLSYRNLYDVGASFATKMVAFANPGSAAVLDKVVCRRLVKLDHHLLRAIGNDFVRVSWNPAKQAELYIEWCGLCEQMAGKLNTEGVRWHDRSNEKRKWRAIDVERAIFAWPGAHA